MGRLMTRFSDFLNRCCISAAIFFLGLMLILVLFQVLARYIFQAVPPWTDEAIRYCMIWGGMLGATAAFKMDRDPRLFSVSPGANRTWSICSCCIRLSAVLIFLGPVLYFSHRFLKRAWPRISEGLEISIMWVNLAVPLAAAVILCHALAKLIEAIDPGTQPEA